MAVFNSVLWVAGCSECGEVVGREVQFRYGETWQHEYMIGDRLQWGKAEVGQPGAPMVIVEGYALPCPNCGFELGGCEVVIEKDRLKSVRELSGRHDFGEAGFVVCGGG